MDCLRYAKVARHTKKHIAQKKNFIPPNCLPHLTHHGPPSAKRHIDHGANIVSRAVVVFVVVVDAE